MNRDEVFLVGEDSMMFVNDCTVFTAHGSKVCVYSSSCFEGSCGGYKVPLYPLTRLTPSVSRGLRCLPSFRMSRGNSVRNPVF